MSTMVAPPSKPLARLLQMPGVSVLTTETFDAFIANGLSLIFFAGNESRYNEITDLAVVLPQLLREFPMLTRIGVVDPDSERKLAVRYKVSLRPTLTLLRDGHELLSLGRLRDWAVYIDEIAKALGETP